MNRIANCPPRGHKPTSLWRVATEESPNWLRRLFGLHVCREFTRWQLIVFRADRAPTPAERVLGWRVVREKRRYQERECLECGKIQQRRLGS